LSGKAPPLVLPRLSADFRTVRLSYEFNSEGGVLLCERDMTRSMCVEAVYSLTVNISTPKSRRRHFFSPMGKSGRERQGAIHIPTNQTGRTNGRPIRRRSGSGEIPNLKQRGGRVNRVGVP